MNIEDENSTKYSKIFSDRLRYLRNKKKISAREMSIALGQNVNYINLIENEKRFPSLQGFFSICDYLGLSPAEFFDSENFSTGTIEKRASSEKEELISLIEALPPEQISAMAQLIKAFKKTF